ncbi:nucleotidyl transferase AbiEii/AbiGii toxin family protein [Burkholderia cenocepacia]|uniref:nucleotidyl transferase AbiEii/AbiGii toxin family protein n=1 Tax=Burkholderia cenocepacia TaxID=95486 RepID=UPI001910F131|nr:nucleotidyl transferase AbiEii/AbiGii toxin family protein [Burkholderia cenocepacia]
MRKITDEWKSDIEDAAAAELLGNLPPAVAEKDVHITDALRELATISVSHTAFRQTAEKGDRRPARLQVHSKLVFSGGTCLSKAHGLIERMSEDIDIKLMLDDVPDGYALPKGQSERARLGDVHRQVLEKLQNIGFTLTEVEGEDNPTSKDSRRYHRLSVGYTPEFPDPAGILRAQLKVELICRPPKLALEVLPMGYMLDQFVGRASDTFDMSCISVAETLAEKVLSLLRRCAWYWGGHQRGAFDTALVRHVYDVWRIQTVMPDVIEAARGHFDEWVQKDILEFRGQNEEFDAEPYRVLR